MQHRYLLTIMCDRTLNILSATADAPKKPQKPGSRGGVRFDVFVRVNGAIAPSSTIPNLVSLSLRQILQPNH
ncbi:MULTISPECIES: hypothetical protein [unclassified Microcoleus]|uniref:hypothetical protein n=1 Tax=unclassified Microcoleus TaxID=2642155 RepID=UPI002FD5F578